MGIEETRKRPMNGELLKLGFALAFSLGGIVFTFLRSRTIKPSEPNPSSSATDEGCEADFSGETDDDFKFMKENHQSKDHTSVSEEPSANALADISSGSKDSFLLPEFDLLLKECYPRDDISSENSGPCLVPDAEAPENGGLAQVEEHETTIGTLQDKVKFLEDRERVLELQLLEYYGLKEQEAVAKELSDRLRVHSMQTKVYQRKIDSLQEDNRKLKAKIADYGKVVMEIEAAKVMVKLLRKKLLTEAEQNRQQILDLQERVTRLQEQETGDLRDDRTAETQIKETRELQEVEEMKKANEKLKMENSELVSKLEKLQVLVTSTSDNAEIEELETESQRLRHENEALSKEIEQLQTDRFADIEEVVYLRWLNACLRYELRNYQPGPSGTTARDLSRTLSPKSEEKAKQLILEYAAKEGTAESMMSLEGFHFGQWPHDAFLYTEKAAEKASNSSSKTKVFAKLMKIWKGKHENVARHSIDHKDMKQEAHILKTPGTSSRTSFDVYGSDSGRLKSSTSAESGSSSQRVSEDGALNIFRRISSIRGGSERLPKDILPQLDSQDSAEADLVKYAQALKISHGKPALRRRSADFASF